jgi:hypothetical protein
MKKIFLVVMLLHGVVTSFAQIGNWTDAGNYADSFSNSIGHEIYISTSEELARLAYLVNNGSTFSGSTIYLLNDIDLSGKYWISIGKSYGDYYDQRDNYNERPFSGIFNGNGHIISNMYCDVTGIGYQYVYAGLFGYNEGIIKNVEIASSCNIISATNHPQLGAGSNSYGNAFSGGITAVNGGTVLNCISNGNVSSTGSVSYAGGIVGRGGIVVNCQNASSINSEYIVGGIGSASIYDCNSTGNISLFYYCGSHTIDNTTNDFDNELIQSLNESCTKPEYELTKWINNGSSLLPMLSSVSTLLPDNITQTKAQVKGISYSKNFKYSEVGIEYKKDSEESYTKIVLATNTTGSNIYFYNITNLFPNTKIQYRIYSDSEEYGKQYGELKEFTTLPVTIKYSEENQVKKLTQTKAELQIPILELETGDIQVSSMGYQLFQGTYIVLDDFAKAALSTSSDPMIFTHQNYSWKISDGYVSSGSPVKIGMIYTIFNPYSSSMKTVLTSKANSKITFSWRTSGGIYSDSFYFYVDGIQKASISYSATTFREVTISLPAGNHILEWIFSRTSDTPSTSNLGSLLVKDIKITNSTNQTGDVSWITIENTSSNNMEISCSLTQLTVDTPYSYRPFIAFNNGYIDYGKSNIFTIQPVKVETQEATTITQTLATLGASFSGDAIFKKGGIEILEIKDNDLTKVDETTGWNVIDIEEIIENKISYNHTSLLPQQIYQYRGFVETEEGEIVKGNIVTFKTSDVVTTSSAIDITQSKVTIKGNIIGNYTDIISQGFEWKKDELKSSLATDIDENNVFSLNLDELQYNSTYSYRAFVTTSHGKIYSDWQEFKTKDISITAGNYASTQTTATLYGSIDIGDAVANIIKVGISCNGILYADNVSTSWSVIQNNLRPNYSYSYYAIAEVDGKQYTSSSKTFTTKSVLANVSTSEVTQTSALINVTYSTGDATFKTSGIQYGSTYLYTTISDTLTYRITELAPNSTYSYRSFITTEEGGTVYSDWKSFTTKPVSLTIQSADAISNTSATIHSDIACDTYSSAEFGFEWRKFDAPDLVPSNTVVAEQFEEKLSFRLKSLVPSEYYKYRSYCKYQNQTYYSEWIAFGTADVFVLYTPDVITIATTDVENNCIILYSYVLEGSENVLQQGFEYWIENNMRSAKDNANVVLTSGTNNRVTISYSDLLPNTTYKFRAFAKTASGTTYGETYNFATPVFSNTNIEYAGNGDNERIIVYPNPVSESFHIKGISKNTLLTISDLTGKTVLQRVIIPNENIIVNHLSKGIYMISADGKTVKMIKN